MRAALLFFLASLLLLTSCGSEEVTGDGENALFDVVDTSFSPTELMIPKQGYTYKVLFQEGDKVQAPNGELAKAKGKNDFLAFLPVQGRSNHGILWVNHEVGTTSDALGDGGGATVIEVVLDSLDGWKAVGVPQSIDFSPVGGTLLNCLGAVTPWGTVLTSEEVEPENNRWFFRNPQKPTVRDTSNYAVPDSTDYEIPRWKNYGWMVEVDIQSRKAIRKLYSMGRFMHEGNYCMPDRRTVYMMDDDAPGVFFKFVADRPADLQRGQLYAFRMAHDSLPTAWIPMPRTLDSLARVREIAFQRGATIFLRMEDIEWDGQNTFYITETGKDSIDLSEAIRLGGHPAPWLKDLAVGNGIYDDPYGRILTYSASNDELKVFLEGGAGEKDNSIHLSNPDNLALSIERKLLVIHEDINGTDKGRIPAGARHLTNEIYTLDLGLTSPTRDDLRRLAVIPYGAESTGGIWSPDGSALFFNIQHPNPSHPRPFNKSTTLVLTGWPDIAP